MGCCFGKESGSTGYSNFAGGGGSAPETEQDRQARLLAAERAAARQQQFEQSAVGRAAYTAVKDAKKPAANVGNSGGADARDWLS
mmetsp:Transcript_29175/g.74448  ORF Transcript_29175/g.74448 Transcript_29175/m.74448 type:complete len:85 (+) Transcript_29175:90-344(+)